MSTTTTNNTVIVRNYIILAATVMFASMGLTDTFLAPTRAGQQNRLDTYGQVVSAPNGCLWSTIRTLTQ